MKKNLKFLRSFFVFFCLMAFVITCCTMLFVSMMSRSMGIEFTEENIQMAAKLTFGNVLLLTFVCSALDFFRRRWTVHRPARRITEAAQKLMQGNFDVRIPRDFATAEGFSGIIDCFNRMAEELSSIETLRADFVSNVSHELKTPLTVIQNYATMLSQPDLPEDKRREYASAIRTASEQLSSLVTNILRLNKLENAQIFPEAKAYDLTEQLCRCFLDFEEILEAKALEVSTELEENVFVKAEPEMMALVWNNLFSNAIKFTDPGGSIGLRLSVDGNWAVVEIQDSGCGISRDVGMHIFDKFYQGDTSHASQGNGLGLALVKRVIDISGSEISVESEVGKGSTFTVKMRRTGNEA